jgi:hypothetical protein
MVSSPRGFPTKIIYESSPPCVLQVQPILPFYYFFCLRYKYPRQYRNLNYRQSYVPLGREHTVISIQIIVVVIIIVVVVIIYLFIYLFLFRSARSIGLRQCLAIRGSCFSFLDPLDIW